ncbi:MAG: 1-deoxy-D-xylulose-5-phosphate reductoisomerase [Gammaproteobacteria bacterium]|nr:MAG: 1-deoxy-D-xylulose-5-phosphate reductoisomerase [Gammaproteobacteria bacterium]
MKGICILGSTGSIGQSTLDVIERHPDRYKVIALTANRSVERLHEQCIRHHPEKVVVVDEMSAETLRKSLSSSGLKDITVLQGISALAEVAALDNVDQVMAAIVGAAGLMPTLSAVRAGKRILLANKEALVMSGRLFMREVEKFGAELLPIDSEHNALFQCMPAGYRVGERKAEVRSLLLTASGGPFRELPLESFREITPEQACAHPKWVMGRKISVDSATMMNKGLELIEASWLFNLPVEQIKVVIHPQSIIHSLVDYVDGTMLAQMGNPDMRIPIAHAMAWPDRIDSGVKPLDLFAIKKLEFETLDNERFPCLELAIKAMKKGGNCSVTLNAANEVAVEAFLNGGIHFTEIALVIEKVMSEAPFCEIENIEQVLDSDVRARALAEETIKALT